MIDQSNTGPSQMTQYSHRCDHATMSFSRGGLDVLCHLCGRTWTATQNGAPCEPDRGRTDADFGYHDRLVRPGAPGFWSTPPVEGANVYQTTQAPPIESPQRMSDLISTIRVFDGLEKAARRRHRSERVYLAVVILLILAAFWIAWWR